jgi:GNAT superfamily N-acetyltransferase
MLTVQRERFADCALELAQLFPVHWEELALFKDRMPLAPQYAEYVAREERGQLFLIVARWDGKIVGYYVAQVAPGFHYERTLTAHQDIVYILPEVRDRGLSLPLFRAVERELKRRGVGPWYAGYKTTNPLGMPKLLDKLGFSPADTYVVKWIGP